MSSFSLNPELFNSILEPPLSDEFHDLISKQRNYVSSELIQYRTPYKDLPAIFDPRDVTTVPKEDIPIWFFDNLELGVKMPVMCTAGAMEQGGCGSCWAFAAASCFTAAIRLNINRIYGADKSCYVSPFFQIIYTCTGESGVAVRGNERKIYGTETCNGVSDYYIVAFSPKIEYIAPVGHGVNNKHCRDLTFPIDQEGMSSSR